MIWKDPLLITGFEKSLFDASKAPRPTAYLTQRYDDCENLYASDYGGDILSGRLDRLLAMHVLDESDQPSSLMKSPSNLKPMLVPTSYCIVFVLASKCRFRQRN
jgi:hypothetical protein